ncbi:MAG: DUF4230 domain-containing protein [Bifidobacterium psychraerophilum]|uniref:DUF4230 domain-containing protein n=1 Tax=Bifidobacterium psychraerophilum TaxID=218140 RepID=UPI0039EA3FC1
MLKRLWKVKIRVVTLLLLIVVGAGIIFMAQQGVFGYKFGFWREPTSSVNVSVTIKKTLPITEINGLAVSTEKVIESEKDGLPLIGGKKMLIVASWRVKLGIDGSKIKMVADDTNHTIKVALPKLKVTSLEQVGTPHVYSQSGSLLDSYSSQDVLDAVNAKSGAVKSAVLDDEDYQQQALDSIKSMLSSIINAAPGVAGNYKIIYSTAQ